MAMKPQLDNDLPTSALYERDGRIALAKMITELFSHWQLSTQAQCELLGLSTSSRATLSRYRRGEPLADNRDLIDRAGHLLAIHKSLRILFPYNPELGYSWMTTANQHFDGKTPMDIVHDQGFLGLIAVRRYLDFERGQ